MFTMVVTLSKWDKPNDRTAYPYEARAFVGLYTLYNPLKRRRSDSEGSAGEEKQKNEGTDGGGGMRLAYRPKKMRKLEDSRARGLGVDSRGA